MLLLIDGGKSAIPEVCDCLPLILTLLSTGISLVLVVIVGPSSVLPGTAAMFDFFAWDRGRNVEGDR